jgi:hypothetical protein
MRGKHFQTEYEIHFDFCCNRNFFMLQFLDKYFNSCTFSEDFPECIVLGFRSVIYDTCSYKVWNYITILIL